MLNWQRLLNYGCGVLIAVLFLSSTTSAWAQLPPSVSSEASVSLLTVYPGEPTYSAWGHSALRFQDPVNGLDASFNFGTFDITVPYFIPRFAYGDMLYQLSVDPTSALFRGAEFQKRSVIEQVLKLDSLQVSAMYDLLLENMKPENRLYQYDFVFDNCSTRLLDLMLAVNGIVLPESDSYQSTIRTMLDEFVHDRAMLDLGIDLVIGSRLDYIPTIRERTFLPIYLMDILDESVTPEGEPFVLETRSILSFDEVPVSQSVQWAVWVAWALLGMSVVWWWRSRALPEAFDRWVFGIVGFAGLFLLLMWFATLHHVTANNWNVAWALPSHFFLALFWKKFQSKQAYLITTGIWTAGIAVFSIFQAQHIPPAMWPVVVYLIWRLLSRSMPQSKVVQTATNASGKAA